MTKAAVSVFFYAVYLLGLGAFLVLAPNELITFFGFPPTQEVWIRVVGMLLLVLTGFYTEMARLELDAFFRLSVYLRIGVFAVLLAYVLAGFAQPVLALFGVVDLAGAAWTAIALHGATAARARPAHA